MNRRRLLARQAAAALLFAAACAAAPPAAAWNSFQTAEALNRFGWELGFGLDLSLSAPRPSASLALSGDLWLRFRSRQYVDTGLWLHVSFSSPFLGVTSKFQFVHGERGHLAADLGLGAGLSGKRVLLLGRAGLLWSWRFARHLALTLGGYLLASHVVGAGPAIGTEIPLHVGFELGGEHVSLRPEVHVTPPHGSVPSAFRLSIGLSFR